jgi:tripartite-type tricarboxylate transporter receptor subunit TctC
MLTYSILLSTTKRDCYIWQSSKKVRHQGGLLREELKLKSETTRREALKLAALGGASLVAGLATPSIVRADKYPSRPIKIVIPFAPGGSSDRLSRVAIPYLQKELGQPFEVVYQPGGGTVLGHTYLLNQPLDGYTICNSAITYIPLTIAQGQAPYKAEDFSMINLPSRDFTMVATAKDTSVMTFGEVIEKLKKNPGSLSLGVQASSVDYVNLVLTLQAAGVDTTKLRVVTYDGGGPVRNATAGGQIDVGFAGAEGFLNLKDKIRVLAGLWDEPVAGFGDAPLVDKIAADMGFKANYLPGSLRGWLVPTKLKVQQPEIFNILVGAVERATKNPEAVKASEVQQLGLVWYGPEASNELYLKTAKILQEHAHILKGS